jgi:hypothetical protein
MYNTQLLPSYIMDKYDYTETKRAVKNYISRLNYLKWYYEVLSEQKVTANYNYDAFPEAKTFSQAKYDNFRLGYLEELIKEKEELESVYQKIIQEYLSPEERLVIEYLYNKNYSITELLDVLKLNNINGGDLKRELMICKSATIKVAVYLGIEVLKNEN